MNSDELPTAHPDPALHPSNEPSSLSDPAANKASTETDSREANLTQHILELQQQEQDLRQEIKALKVTRAELQAQTLEAQVSFGRLVQQNLSDLEQRRQTLQLAIEQLERRQDRIRNEMRTTFAGASQDIAIRVQSFKDYLVGSLQDLAIAADQLELQTSPAPVPSIPPPRSVERITPSEAPRQKPTPKFAEEKFQDEGRQVRSIIDQFRNQPDYYGPVWKLRRTFEPVHAERVSNWFFTQGGKGAIRTMGSRLQNILIASATISILYNLYDDRLRTLILANSPERLGEWRRGLQDCLGVSRSDFGSDRGITMFETPEQLALKAERLEKDGYLPLIVIDETEEAISLALLQFPLWLAFAPTPQQLVQQQSYLY
ncbi:DUF3086 domain-containing protein [Myxacorys almedinensis]|uniref:DUF3086 domain-containing protein n=1 Tax=Myxacorys almedinensis A TaxID=2690445 RepID=A0A8J7ZA53_9CYAN|nr:DUF3086 domain-containing protein [Myxacorys almedinensis]NDJ19183.1 DUF3086 domain-containing protein [Myxacorys almedinensis A]